MRRGCGVAQACLSALFLGAAVGAVVAYRRVRKSLLENGLLLPTIEGSKVIEELHSPAGTSNALRLSYGPSTPSKVFPLLQAEDSESPLPLPLPLPAAEGSSPSPREQHVPVARAAAGAAAGKPEVFV